MGHPTWRYSLTCPKGQIFDSDKMPSESEGWFDSPAKIGLRVGKVDTEVSKEIGKSVMDEMKELVGDGSTKTLFIMKCKNMLKINEARIKELVSAGDGKFWNVTKQDKNDNRYMITPI